MRKSVLVKSIMAFAFLVAFSASAFAVSGPYTVYARVVSAGSTAVITKFQYDNPATGYHSKTLGKSIYSITQDIYMADANGNGFSQLPAGEYSFVVGGLTGASGVLVCELHP